MISSTKALQAIEQAEIKAKELGIDITTVVVDEHGTLIAAKRMDNAFIVSPDFAFTKAYTSATLKVPTSGLGEFVTPGNPYYGLSSLGGGKFCAIAGGIPVIENGKVVGAIGVGGAADVSQDEICAKAALEAIK